MQSNISTKPFKYVRFKTSPIIPSNRNSYNPLNLSLIEEEEDNDDIDFSVDDYKKHDPDIDDHEHDHHDQDDHQLDDHHFDDLDDLDEVSFNPSNDDSDSFLSSKRKSIQNFFKLLVFVILTLLLLVLAITNEIVSTVKSNERLPQVCPRPYTPFSSTVSCDKNFEVGTICSIMCKDGYIMTGSGAITCNSSLLWSSKLPACKKKYSSHVAENNCSHSTSWKYLKHYISVSNPFLSDIKINYEGNKIKCFSSPILHYLILTWKVVCTDQHYYHDTKCKHKKSRKGAVKQALANLITLLVKKKLYPKPCDPAELERDAKVC